MLVVALIGLAADQASKARAFAPASESAGPRSLAPGLTTAVLARNDGAMANLAGGHTVTATVCALNGLVMLAAFSWSFRCCDRWRRHDAVFVGLLSAGMLGNTTDRLVLGYVRDFLVAAPFPTLIFNLADVFIVLGFLLLLGSWATSRRGVPRATRLRGWSSP